MVLGKLIPAVRTKHHRVLLSNIRCTKTKHIFSLTQESCEKSIKSQIVSSDDDELTISMFVNNARRPIILLVDTGSSISLVNINIMNKNTNFNTQNTLELTSATGHNTSTLASCSSEININNIILNFVFHVYDGRMIPIKYDGILGYDFFKKYNCIINIEKHFMSLKIPIESTHQQSYDTVESIKINKQNGSDEALFNNSSSGMHSFETPAQINKKQTVDSAENKLDDNCDDDDIFQSSMRAFIIASNSPIAQRKKKGTKHYTFPFKNYRNESHTCPMYTNTSLCSYLRFTEENKNNCQFIGANSAKVINVNLLLQDGHYVLNAINILPKVSLANALIEVNNNSSVFLIKNLNNFPIKLNESFLTGCQFEDISKYHIFALSLNNNNNEHMSRSTYVESSLNFDHSDPNITKAIKSLCTKFNDCFYIPGDKITHTEVIEHKINLKPDAVPKFVKQYRIPESVKAELQRQLNEMEYQNIIAKSTSSGWNSPLILVPKSDENGVKNKFRLVVDFRKLNEATVPIHFPIPTIDSIIDQLAHSKVFSTLDLHGAFYQIKLAEASRELTSFQNNNFSYRFLSMPQGLHTSPATMQNAVNLIFKDLLNKGVNVYFDDILVYTETIDSHFTLLETVFTLLREHNFKLKIEKCKFLRKEVEYLGHVITENGCKPNQNKINCIRNYPRPTNVTETQRWLGLTNYYRSYIPKYAFHARPLYNLLKKDNPFTWDSHCDDAFNKLKTALMSPPVLIFPNFNQIFIVTTDASNIAVGAVLSQGTVPNDRPIQFASKVLNDAQRNYSTIEKELYAIVYATETFRHFLYGVKFDLYTDHRPLLHLFNIKNPSGRLYRWKAALTEYDFKIQYKRGSQNTVADALSRLENVMAITRSRAKQSFIPTPVENAPTAQNYNIEEYNNLLINTQTVDHIFFIFNSTTCEAKRKLEHKLKTNIVLAGNLLPCLPHRLNDNITIFIMPDEKIEIERITKIKLLLNTILDICNRHDYQDIAVNIDMKSPKSYFEFKFIYREIFCQTSIKSRFHLNKVMEVFDLDQILEILNIYHNSSIAGHSSFEKTKNSIRRYYSWPTMNKDIKRYIDNCNICKKTKITRHTHSPMMITSTAEFPFQKVYIDFVNVERQHQNTYPCIFTCIDELTKYAIAVRAKNCTALLAAKKFVKHVILKYNIPDSVVSDQGSAFLSETFKEITKLFKIKKITTTPYRPNANIVERFHRTLAQHLISCVHLNPLAWHEHLDSAVFAYNNTVNAATGFSPHELIFGYRVQLPNNIIKNDSVIYNYDNFKDELQRTLRSYWKTAKENIDYNKIQNKSQRDKHANPINIKIGDEVYLRKPFKNHKFDTPYAGPFTVEEILSPVTVKLKTDNKIITVHTDKLKPS